MTLVTVIKIKSVSYLLLKTDCQKYTLLSTSVLL